MNIAAGAGSVWTSNQGDGTISRIDASTGSVTATITVGGQPGGVGFGDGSLWVANFGDGTVERVDPTANAVTARIPVGGQPDGATVSSDGTVWISDFAGAVLRIDPTTNAVAARIPVPGNPSSPVLAFGLLWIGNVDGSVRTIDPSDERDRRIARRASTTTQTPSPPTRNGVWATTFDSGTVALIDPTSRSVVRKGVVPGHASGLVARRRLAVGEHVRPGPGGPARSHDARHRPPRRRRHRAARDRLRGRRSLGGERALGTVSRFAP